MPSRLWPNTPILGDSHQDGRAERRNNRSMQSKISSITASKASVLQINKSQIRVSHPQKHATAMLGLKYKHIQVRKKYSVIHLENTVKQRVCRTQNLCCCSLHLQRLPSECCQLPCTHFDKILSDQLSMDCLDRAGRSPNVCLRSC